MSVPPVLVPGSKLMLVGEAPSAADEAQKALMSGPAGKELDLILKEVGIKRSEISVTNVFNERPPKGNVGNWAIPRKDLKSRLKSGLPWKPIPCVKGVIGPEQAQPALARLHAELASVRPNIVIALGNTALAALCGVSGITKARGAIHMVEPLPGWQLKVLPTYHPAAVLLQYEWHPLVVIDFMKALSESASPLLHLINRRLHLAPTIKDLSVWERELRQAQTLGVDVETKVGQITCIGFAPSKTEAYVLPFWTETGNYWRNLEDEVEAYKFTRRILEMPSVKVFQNGLYDLQYSCLRYHIAPKNCLHDTMLLHHSLYPALPKALDFLGSLYCNEQAWKRWRTRGDEDLKVEE